MPREETKEEEAERKALTAYDLIRVKLEHLQKNIDKPAPIPPRPEKLTAPKAAPEFVRNVVGSTAAAGSAEYHIFRNLRRREQNRLDYINAKAKMEQDAEEFEAERLEIQQEEEQRTAKKRAKRQRQKDNKRKRKTKAKKEGESSSDDDSDDDEEEAPKTEAAAQSSS
ncbi:unnamed protein product, partial [Mesorhabditis spiculigera]